MLVRYVLFNIICKKSTFEKTALSRGYLIPRFILGAIYNRYGQGLTQRSISPSIFARSRLLQRHLNGSRYSNSTVGQRLEASSNFPRSASIPGRVKSASMPSLAFECFSIFRHAPSRDRNDWSRASPGPPYSLSSIQLQQHSSR